MKNFRIAFEQHLPGLAEHSAPVIAACLLRKNIIVCVNTPENRDLAFLKDAFRQIPGNERIRYLTYEESLHGEPFDAVFSIMPSSPGLYLTQPDSPTNIPRIAATHGLTDKRSKFPVDGLERPLGYFNVLFATGPAMFRGSWEAYIKRNPISADALRIFEIGAPKTDVLLNAAFDRTTVLQGIGLDPARSTVLYAPTFQKEASLEQHGLQIIEQLSALDINLIVRLHHYSIDLENQEVTARGHRGKDWRTIMQKLCKQHPNMRYVEGDSNPWFVAADVLVGDVSGASFEYILQNKPVVFIDVPEFFHAQGTEGIGYWGRYAGDIVYDIKHLGSTVQRVLKEPNALQSKRQQLIHDLVYHPGQAATQTVDTLIGLMTGELTYPTWGPKTALQHDYMMHECICERMASLHKKKVALFGAGQHTEKLLHLMQTDTTRRYPTIQMILDDKPPAANKYPDIPIYKPEETDISSIDCIILSSDYFQDKMKARCKELYGKAINVIDLYDAFYWHRKD